MVGVEVLICFKLPDIQTGSKVFVSPCVLLIVQLCSSTFKFLIHDKRRSFKPIHISISIFNSWTLQNYLRCIRNMCLCVLYMVLLESWSWWNNTDDDEQHLLETLCRWLFPISRPKWTIIIIICCFWRQDIENHCLFWHWVH